MSEKERPTPPLNVVRCDLTKQNAHAIYFTVVFRDACGRLWTTQGANFLYDMKPAAENPAELSTPDLVDLWKAGDRAGVAAGLLANGEPVVQALHLAANLIDFGLATPQDVRELSGMAFREK